MDWNEINEYFTKFDNLNTQINTQNTYFNT
jgi:hypothetical protein